MIKMTLFTKSEQMIGFKMSGHAGFDAYGKDIVCAAASVLAINTVNAIETFTHDKFDCTVKEKEGQLQFRIISNVSEQSELLLNALRLGIIGIEQQYGNDYININIEEV
ncbi:MAG: ribosomal-processing cysteine protease Prp [Vallitaleaceae bacterium]|nr:ribosomal-processing cysteine protease Prp [Vallitaleaceae bacterium]